jgi:mono/diheme cytochrome c family protein
LASFLAGCGEPVLREPQRLGGVEVEAATLERGRRSYQRYCILCHGSEGDGLGPNAAVLWPRPRDFRTARFKYAGVENRGLPSDEELARIVRGGLDGTAMQPWDLDDAELGPLIQYIKTFSPPGKGFRDPRRMVQRPIIPPDPFHDQKQRAQAVRDGERLYHAQFECAKCHASYVAPARFHEWGAEPRTDSPYAPVPKWAAEYSAVLLPPDFLRHPLRSIRVFGNTVEPEVRADDLYRVIAYGLQGPMPGYGHLGAESVWAVAYYVKMLAELRLRGEGAELAAKMRGWAAGQDPQK